ncbi:hypothetical protein C8J57DRAFT_1228438 [Mycena rebaudengoi]|nr:hypothetical protein C8J57DRAFT_1228438 [Mycena rebaudengoi]
MTFESASAPDVPRMQDASTSACTQEISNANLTQDSWTPNPGTKGKGLLHGSLWIKHRPSIYTPVQVRQWLAKIGYPGQLDDFAPSLESLTHLARLSLTTFPFENTAMHYTESHSIDITYEGLFERMVASPGDRGSYCFGLNGLLFQMLRGLGFRWFEVRFQILYTLSPQGRVYTGAGHVNKQPPGAPPIFHSYPHMILFVQPEPGLNTTYLVDVAAAGSVHPILLEEGTFVDGASPASEKHALTRVPRVDSNLESSTNSENPPKLEWRLESVQIKKDPAQPPSRRVMYTFLEDEFSEADFLAANDCVLGLREGFFWENVVCARFFWMSDDEVRRVDGGEEGEDGGSDHGGVEGKVGGSAPPNPLTRYLGRLAMVGDAVRRHIGAQTTVVMVMKNELERAEALKKFFGIRVPRENLRYIKGRGADLKI